MELDYSYLASAENPWGFGWEALVAIGTLALAIGTVALALKTRDLATEAAADRRAQWRPVLLPSHDEFTPRGGGGAGGPQVGDAKWALLYDSRMRTLVVQIRNTGRGPALHIRAQVECPDMEGAISPESWSLGALAANQDHSLVFNNVQFAAHVQLLLDYRDLSGHAYATACTITRQSPNPPRVYDVRVFDGHSVTSLGDAVYPQAGLRDARPNSG